MNKQLEYLQNEIDQISFDSIKNNRHPLTILEMFKTISKNIEAIRKGKKPYGLDSLEDIQSVTNKISHCDYK